MANIPPWAMNVIQSLNEEQQTTLIQVAAKFAMDPWFVSMASIPAALQLIYVPHFVKFAAILPLQHVNYNNVTPRYTNWDNETKSKSVADFIKRCVSCHQNSWEAFMMFAPAVLMCRIQKADPKAVKELCVQFLKLRFIYTVLYIFGQWSIVSWIRTIIWTAGVKTVVQLYSTALMV